MQKQTGANVDNHQAILELKGTSETDVNEVLQRELTRITLINANILDMATNANMLDSKTLDSIKDDLQLWYREIPAWLQLNAILDPAQTRLVGAQVCVACYLHLYYLAAIALKTRVIFSALLKQDDGETSSDSETPSAALQDGLSAAKICAQILNLLYERNIIFPKCWLCM